MNNDEIQEEADSIMQSVNAKIALGKLSKRLKNLEETIKGGKDLEDGAKEIERMKGAIEALERENEALERKIERKNMILDVANRWEEKSHSE
jgi:hypothetical protein